MPHHSNHAPAVTELQRYLRQLSFAEPSIPRSPIDGIFDSRTAEALREFQRLRGLPVTGRADFETWERLYADYRASLAKNSPPRMVHVFPIEPFDHLLTLGSIGFAVTALQYMLLELHYVYQDLENIVVTGIYDEQTANAVRRFQEKNRLSPTGSVDPLTWNTITDQYNTLFLRTWRE